MRKQTLLSIVLSLIILISSIGIVLTNTMAISDNSNILYNEPRSSRIIIKDTDWDIISYENHTDEIIYLNANISIGNNGILDLENTTIIVNENTSLGYVYSISVGSGGSLILESSTITNNASANTDYELEFAIGSMGDIKNSTISMCGYDSMSGLYVQSQDITFTNSFLDNNYIGINCFKANATLENCWINNSDFSAFVCNDSQVNVYDSKITDNTREYYLENSSTLRLFSSPIPEGINTVMDTSELEIHWWLTVNVTDLSGSPLEGATVDVLDSYGTIISTGITNLVGQVTGIDCQELTRNETGFNESTPHNVKASLDGYFDAEQEVTMDGDQLVELEMEAEPEKGNISGIVTKIDESPIEGVKVNVEYEGGSASDTTDAAGRYELIEVPEGTDYTVIVSGEFNNMTPYKSGRNESVAVAAGDTTIVDFILEENPLPLTVQVRALGTWINADGAEDVDVDTPIKVSFDQPMNNTTIEGNVKLKLGSTDVSMTMTILDEDVNKEFLFTHTEPLQKGKTYNLVVSDGVRRNLGVDVAMLWKDYIISFDTEFEPIVDRNPQPGATNVDTLVPIIFVVFHNSINLSLPRLTQSFGLQRGTTRIDGTVAFDTQDGQKVIFTPEVELQSLTEYTIVVSDDLLDAEGNPILRDQISRTWNFTTRETTTEVAGRVADKDGNAIPNATVSLLNALGDPIATMDSDENGIFEFTGIEPGVYNLSIEVKGYKPYTQEVNPGVGTPTNLPQINLEKKAEGDGDDEGIDPMWIILIIILVIIIIIIAGVAMRKPKPIEEPYEEMGAEERVGVSAAAAPARVEPSAAPARMRGAPPEPAYREVKEGVPKTSLMHSMSRCPICAHRLMATGECFHCRMDQMYGQY